MDAKTKALLASYGRSVLAGVVALYMAGVTDPMDLWTALVAAAAPVIIRAVNPKDAAFGKVPKVELVEKSVEAAVSEAVARKAAKPASKKATTTKKKSSKNDPKAI